MNTNNTYMVYCHTNLSNGKRYVGITHLKTYKRWGHKGNGYKKCTLFWKAIKKYGWDNFQHIVVCQGLSLEDAKKEEQRLIAINKSNDVRFGYNVSSGGDMRRPKGFHHSEETKRKIGFSQIGKIMSEKAIEKMKPTMFKKGQTPWNNGIPMSKEKYEKCKNTMFQRGREATNKRKIVCVELNIIFGSLKEAEEKTGISRSNICQSLRGKRYKAGGYRWEYVESEYE